MWPTGRVGALNRVNARRCETRVRVRPGRPTNVRALAKHTRTSRWQGCDCGRQHNFQRAALQGGHALASSAL